MRGLWALFTLTDKATRLPNMASRAVTIKIEPLMKKPAKNYRQSSDLTQLRPPSQLLPSHDPTMAKMVPCLFAASTLLLTQEHPFSR
jgi:hypothetical protein